MQLIEFTRWRVKVSTWALEMSQLSTTCWARQCERALTLDRGSTWKSTSRFVRLNRTRKLLALTCWIACILTRTIRSDRRSWLSEQLAWPFLIASSHSRAFLSRKPWIKEFNFFCWLKSARWYHFFFVCKFNLFSRL